MYHDCDLVGLGYAELFGDCGVVDFVYALDF